MTALIIIYEEKFSILNLWKDQFIISGYVFYKTFLSSVYPFTKCYFRFSKHIIEEIGSFGLYLRHFCIFPLPINNTWWYAYTYPPQCSWIKMPCMHPWLCLLTSECISKQQQDLDILPSSIRACNNFIVYFSSYVFIISWELRSLQVTC